MAGSGLMKIIEDVASVSLFVFFDSQTRWRPTPGIKRLIQNTRIQHLTNNTLYRHACVEMTMGLGIVDHLDGFGKIANEVASARLAWNSMFAIL